jgi:hypothetical protein
MKLSSEQRAELLNEMELAEQFTEKRWSARFGISIPTVRRLRREARERRERLIPNVSQELHVIVFNINGSRKKRVHAA